MPTNTITESRVREVLANSPIIDGEESGFAELAQAANAFAPRRAPRRECAARWPNSHPARDHAIARAPGPSERNAA